MKHGSLAWGCIVLSFAPLPAAAQQMRAGDAGPVARPAPVSGEVVSTRLGEDIRFTGETARRRVVAGQDLKAGDVVRTNSRGGVAIVFADRTQIRLARNSELEVRSVSRGNPSEVRVRTGSAWGRSPRGRTNLRVSTPSATAAIRGTEWRIDVTDESTRLEVISGLVSLENDLGSVNVGSGEAASAAPDSAPVKLFLVNRPAREQLLYSLTSATNPAEAGDPTLSQARELAFAGDLAAAINLLVQPEQRSAANFALTLEIATLLGQEELIADQLADAKQLYPDNPLIMIREAEFLATYRGRPDLALVEAESAARLQPGDVDILLELARTQLARHADQEALESINRALAVAPDRPDLLAFRADVWLALNRPNHALADITRADEIASGNSLTLLGRAHVAAVLDSPDAALDSMLAASAANPGYGAGLRQLAEAFARSGDRQVAEQQLDAADQLDPYSPYTPLFRNAIALDRYETDAAVAAANEALRRFSARGGIYESLAENRQTGSSLSRSFRIADLQGMARYYADRVYDSFSSMSYFDQVLNEEAGLFFLRQASNGFNPRNGDDVRQTSTYLQGVLLDPLSIASSKRNLQIAREEFSEASLSGRTIRSGLEDQYLGTAGLNARVYPTLGGGELPIAFSIEGRTSRLEDQFLKSVRDASSLDSYLGLELTPADNLVFYGSFKTENYQISPDHQANIARFGGEHDSNEDQIFAVALWNHSMGFRRNFSIGYAFEQKGDVDVFYEPLNAAATTDILRTTLNEGPTSHILTAQFADASGPVEWRLGVETGWSSENKRFSFDILDVAGQIRPGSPRLDNDRTAHELRGYGNIRYSPSDRLVVEGQLSVLQQRTALNNGSLVTSDSVTRLDYRLGAALELVKGHWLRLLTESTTTTAVPFSLAPIYIVGLRSSIVPSQFQSQQTGQIVRWDANWTRNFFTSAEVQRQRVDSLSYLTPDRDALVSIAQANIDRARIEANYLPGGNFALHASFNLARTSGLVDLNVARQTLPYLPQRVAELGINWSHGSRIAASLTGTYVGPQRDIVDRPIGGHRALDFLARWEPFDRQIEVNFGILNILGEGFEIQPGVPAPQRAVLLGLKGRI